MPEIVSKCVVEGKITDFKLSDYLGKYTVLVINPIKIAELERIKYVQVIAVLRDSVYALKEKYSWLMPIVSDVTLEIGKKYCNCTDGLHGIFIISPTGILRHF